MCRVPRRLSRVAPGPCFPFACRGGDQFPAGLYLNLHFLPSSNFNKFQTLNWHNFHSTSPFFAILFPTRS
ncbi:hypothetical protein HanXRQr2_Chr04g0176651 [Helianthus annuus]|uniref:Uncharacterized protein n=1 Tax=Helianthus annuus TaxID=4232 RepID=A0A9K3NSN1_HELAN|nr:hypothetical protein HanXRQr2_Chr04g0176651 [Helianthus annuus]